MLPNIFNLVINYYGFDYCVLENDHGEEAEKDNNHDNDSADAIVDDKNEKKYRVCKQRNTGRKEGQPDSTCTKKKRQRRAF